MNDRPQPLPIRTLGRWILGEAHSRGTVFGVPVSLFPRLDLSSVTRFDFFGQALASPIGPAAGPHSQLSQNIVLAYLCGGRFLELKTAQVEDEIEVLKPCIDAADLGFNCEWSQEMRLPQTLCEYLKAELLVHLVRCELLAEPLDAPRAFAFNASVGYDLRGLRSPKMRAYVSRLLAGHQSLRAKLAQELAPEWPLARDAASLRPATTSLTLSTMHGCPSREIEAIATFLLETHRVPLLLKLNPTVLGKSALLGILRDELGHTQLEVPDEAFEHDPSLDEVLDVVRAISAKAKSLGLGFGLKLTNTLELRRPSSFLPATQSAAYMSGRALFPLMLQVAARLRDQLGPIPLAAAGGLDPANIAEARDCGLGPLTLCTELLRPGGYAALAACVRTLESSPSATTNLEVAAAQAARNPRYSAYHLETPRRPARELMAFDCNAAPCSIRCPAGQEAPRYLRALAVGDRAAALEAVLERNPLASITGHVCPAPCEATCVRGHTGEPLAIRALKRVASFAELRSVQTPPQTPAQIAVIGTGPAGLAVAAFLSRAGVQVRLFEQSCDIGGVPGRAIPQFRLPHEALSLDLARVLEHPLVTLVVNDNPLASGGLVALQERGFSAVVLATGAGPGRRLRVPGEDLEGVHDGLAFLEGLRRGEAKQLGSRVLVVGGGSSAVDTARAAKRLVGEAGCVEIVYRRTLAMMPAHREELRAAQEEGVTIVPLCVPIAFEGDGVRLTGLRVMDAALEVRAGERPRPVPVSGSERVLPASTVLVAIGQTGAGTVELGLPTSPDGRLVTDEHCRCPNINVYAIGDARRGPATVIEAVADAGEAAREILRQLHRAAAVSTAVTHETLSDLLEHKARSAAKRAVDLDLAFAAEASRCLSCDVLCGLCAIVCPNRANLLYESAGFDFNVAKLEIRRGEVCEIGWRSQRVTQRFQVVNLGEPCNACGNCAIFCPSSGAPYLNKPRLWLHRRPAGERGFELRRTIKGYRATCDSDQGQATLTKQGRRLRFTCGPFDLRLGMDLSVLSARCRGEAEGAVLDLELAAQMLILGEGVLASSPYLFSSPHNSSSARSGVSGVS